MVTYQALHLKLLVRFQFPQPFVGGGLVLIRRVLFAAIVGSLFLLPVVAADNVSLEDEASITDQNEVGDYVEDAETVEPSTEPSASPSPAVDVVEVTQNQETINNNIVFMSASVLSLGGVLLGYFSAKDLLKW